MITNFKPYLERTLAEKHNLVTSLRERRRLLKFEAKKKRVTKKRTTTKKKPKPKVSAELEDIFASYSPEMKKLILGK